LTRTSPAFPGASAVTSVPSACVTAALQPKLTVTCEGSTSFGGNASQVLMTRRLSATGSIVNALLVTPFAVVTTSAAAGVAASPMLGRARESSYGIWTVIAATRQSEGTVGGGGAPPLLHPFNCWTANSGAGTDCFGDDWFIVTETPANEFGSGKLVAFCGFAVPMLNPETNSVVICPGETRIVAGLAYPDPVKVIPWPNSGERSIKTAQRAARSIRRIDSISDVLEPKAVGREGSARYTPILTPSTFNWKWPTL